MHYLEATDTTLVGEGCESRTGLVTRPVRRDLVEKGWVQFRPYRDQVHLVVRRAAGFDHHVRIERPEGLLELPYSGFMRITNRDRCSRKGKRLSPSSSELSSLSERNAWFRVP